MLDTYLHLAVAEPGPACSRFIMRPLRRWRVPRGSIVKSANVAVRFLWLEHISDEEYQRGRAAR